MNDIEIPKHINYIGVFLTYRCNLNCNYCINRYSELKGVVDMIPSKWVQGLDRIETRNDLPITLQGGEPTLYSGFYPLVQSLYFAKKSVDVLTNGMFDAEEFAEKTTPKFFNRDAKYASIRFSYHRTTPEDELLDTVQGLQDEGYSVGIWGLSNDSMKVKNEIMSKECKSRGIDFRMKEYLSGVHGTYKYENAHTKKYRRRVLCKPSEILINPSGHLFRCHSDLYANRNPYGHILDEHIDIPEYRVCYNFGYCNPCDVKTKTNRFQEFGYTSVDIKEWKGGG